MDLQLHRADPSGLLVCPRHGTEFHANGLEDYQLACQAGGVDNDDFIIRNLPLFLADSAQAWLEHLPSNAIQSWVDLKEIFVGNFWSGRDQRPVSSRKAGLHPQLLLS